MLIGARLNWLLSHGKGKTWGGKTHKDWGGQKFIQIDISPQEADSNVRIDAPVVGDIGSCVSALLAGIGSDWAKPPAEWTRRRRRAQEQEHREDGRDAGQGSGADEFPQRAERGARHHQGQPGRHPGQRRRQRARLHAQHRGHVQAAQAPRRRHLGHHGHRHGLLRRGRRGQRRAGDRDRGRQRLRLLRHGSRDHLPLQPAGVHRRHEQQRRLPRHRRQSDRRPRRGAHRVREGCALRQDDRGLRWRGRARHDPGRAAQGDGRGRSRSRKPTLINAVIDETAGTESGRITSLNPTAKKK